MPGGNEIGHIRRQRDGSAAVDWDERLNTVSFSKDVFSQGAVN